MSPDYRNVIFIAYIIFPRSTSYYARPIQSRSGCIRPDRPCAVAGGSWEDSSGIKMAQNMSQLPMSSSTYHYSSDLGCNFKNLISQKFLNFMPIRCPTSLFKAILVVLKQYSLSKIGSTYKLTCKSIFTQNSFYSCKRTNVAAIHGRRRWHGSDKGALFISVKDAVNAFQTR